MANKKHKKLVFKVEEAKPSVIKERGFFSSNEAPAIDVFFRINKKIPTKTSGTQNPMVAYTSCYEGYLGISQSQVEVYLPKTYLLGDGRYKMVLRQNQDFHRAIRGLACFIRFGGQRYIHYSSEGAFSESNYPSTKNPYFEIEYASKELEKILVEI